MSVYHRRVSLFIYIQVRLAHGDVIRIVFNKNKPSMSKSDSVLV